MNLNQIVWEPANTFVLLVSILEFENAECHGWDKSNRNASTCMRF